MKKKPNILVIMALILVVGYVTTINDSWAFIGDVKGKYHLEGNGNCHLLSFNQDTLILEAEGKLISDNFEGNPRYEVEEVSFIGRKIIIHYENGKASMELLITRTLFGKFKIRTCMDLEEYYVKYE
jgi:hypothetical protein